MTSGLDAIAVSNRSHSFEIAPPRRSGGWRGVAAYLGLLGALLGESAGAAEIMERDRKPTPPEAIVHWERAGLRWAIGRGVQGQVLVVSDLSFPWLVDRALLFKVGGKQGLRDSVESSPEHESLLRPLLKPLARAEQQLLGQEGEIGLSEVIAVRAGESRSLADLDWETLSVQQGRTFRRADFAQAWGKLARAFFGETVLRVWQSEVERVAPLGSVASESFGGELLRASFFWEGRVGGEGIEFIFDPQRALRERFGVRGEIPSPAKTVVDFGCPSCGFWEMMGFDALNNAIDIATSFIPVPGLQQVLGTAFDRLFHYREEAYRLQWAMLHEALAAAAMRPETTPEGAVFQGLSSEEREKAASIVQFSDSKLTTVIRWLWKRPLKAWWAGLERDQKRSDLAAHWLRERGRSLDYVTPHFALGRSLLGDQWLYSLAAYRVFPSITEPAIVVDYQKPDYLKVRRIAMDSATAAVGFASRFAPWVGYLVRLAWTAAVEQPQRVLQQREARLAWVLETRDPELRTYAEELRVIEGQRMNPFVFGQRKMREQVEKRWQALRVALLDESRQGLGHLK